MNKKSILKSFTKPFFYFFYLQIFYISCGIINHIAILQKDFDFNLRNIFNLSSGLAYDVGHGSILAFLPLLLWKHFPRLSIILSFVIYLFISLFNFADYQFYRELGTHIPFYAFSYAGQAGNFSSSFSYIFLSQSFLLMVVIPALLFSLIAFYLLKQKNENELISGNKLSAKVWLLQLFLVLIVYAIGNSIGNSTKGKTNENPLQLNSYRYLKITIKSRKKMMTEIAKPDAILKDWPKLTNGFTYYFYQKNKDNKYPFYKKQPRVLCQNNKLLVSENELSLFNKQHSTLDKIFCSTPANSKSNLLPANNKIKQNNVNTKKNIIFILLENFRAKTTGTYGNKENLTPNFDRWAKKGILFTNFYSSGARTKDAMVSTYCSILPIPLFHIMKYYKKDNMECLPEVLKKNNYTTAWIHNGNAAFDYRLGFFKKHGFDYIIDKAKMPLFSPSAGWGYTDEVLVQEAIKNIKKFKRPYFAALLSISNHHPFEVPKAFRKYSGSDDYKRYKDTQHYTDYAFGLFMKEIQKMPDYKNTIIIVSGDHANHLHLPPETKNTGLYHRYRAQVPFLIIVPGMKKGMIQEQRSSHIDIAPTIVDILGIDVSNSWFGLSAFIQDKRKPVLSFIDNTYTGIFLQNKLWFSGTKSYLNTGAKEEKISSINSLLKNLQKLNHYILQKDLFLPLKTKAKE